MKNKLIIAFVFILVFGVGIIFIIYKNNYEKLDDNYFARLCVDTNEYISCNYLYMLEDDYRYISTRENTIFNKSIRWNIKIIEGGQLQYPQDIFRYFDSTKGYIILNENVNDDESHKQYYKGDLLTSEELYNLIVVRDKDFNRNLVFSIYSIRLNCNTARLYVYNDNTYEYFYTYSVDEKNLKVKQGFYIYDISKILNNISDDSSDYNGTFILTDNNGVSYYLADDNIELNYFLESIDISLDACLIEA